MSEALAATPSEAAEGPLCANCAMRLLGPYCYGCGQHCEAHHRSVRHLMGEMLENLTEADSRLWRTLVRLVRQPGRLTRDYIAGHRVAEIPPLRLFVVALVVVFAVGALGRSNHDSFSHIREDSAKIHSAINGITIKSAPGLARWLRVHAGDAVDDPAEVVRTMREWAERFAFLLLPFSAISLKLLFPIRRDVTLYDHLIFTLHSLSFAGMLIALLMVLVEIPVARNWAGLLILALPVHLFVHMRGVYRTGVAGTLVRMALLGSMTGVVFLLMLTGLALLSLGLA